ncbi:hypothetical protein EUTSA_v10022401mg [Eutrema salsugineum]|uniref:F-box associated beta-propeller type 1 domain-containing protein n=1 Tax=Eutrema salsugineum TaxID=72664 RepID=V4LCL3_EUTSA|nr:putative F-box protein At3g17500 [Eutrema salsugineum]ESQ48175.1 hypothetical protein EUTSA_v10022401mg [Eutrema salsugineum]
MTRKTLRLLDLPWELIEEEILSRVPLSRLRFTCKRWKAFTLKNLRVSSESINLHEVHNNALDPSTLLSLNEFHNLKQVEICKIFHCDGLLLCTTRDDFRLVVWNPCTGQTRWIQDSKRYGYYCEFALGYENNKSCQSYKILRYLCTEYKPSYMVVEYEIYEFSSDSWRDRNRVCPYFRIVPNSSVSLKGNTYWLAHNVVKEGQSLISCFDFSTEKLWSMKIPNSGADSWARALSVVGEERLSVLYQKRNPLKIEIWMTTDDKIDNQTKVLWWSKFLYVDIYEDTLHQRIAFFVDEEKKAAVLCDRKFLYGQDMRDTVYIVGEDNLCIKIPQGEYRSPMIPLIFNYVPSFGSNPAAG